MSNETGSVEKFAYNIKEACSALSLGRNTVLELIHSGKLRHKRVGRRIIVPRKAVEEFLGQEHEEAQ